MQAGTAGGRFSAIGWDLWKVREGQSCVIVALSNFGQTPLPEVLQDPWLPRELINAGKRAEWRQVTHGLAESFISDSDATWNAADTTEELASQLFILCAT